MWRTCGNSSAKFLLACDFPVKIFERTLTTLDTISSIQRKKMYKRNKYISSCTQDSFLSIKYNFLFQALRISQNITEIDFYSPLTSELE